MDWLAQLGIGTSEYIETVAGLLVGLGVLSAPGAMAAGALALRPDQRIDVPATVVAGTGCYFAVAAILRQFVPPGLGQALLAVCLSAGGAFWLARSWALRGWRQHEQRGGGLLWVFPVIFATVAILDGVVIYSLQSWGVDGRSPHIVSPMQLDSQRNAVVAAALLRDSDTLFVPASTMLYQLAWYSGVSNLLALLPDTASRYHQVAGLSLATGWIVYASVLRLAIAFRYPRTPLHVAGLCAVAILIVADTRLDNIGAFTDFLVAIGIARQEEIAFYRYFSLKYLALTAPQHALFFVFFLELVVQRNVSPNPVASRFPPWMFFFVAALVSSPVLAAFVFPFYFLCDLGLRAKREEGTLVRNVLELVVGSLVAVLVHYALVRIWIPELYMRGGAVTPQTILHGEWSAPATLLPLLFVICNGLLGAGFSALAPFRFLPTMALYLNRPESRVTGLACGTAVLGAVFWNGIITDIEFRRHFSMAQSVLVSAFVMVFASSLLANAAARWWAFVAVAAMAVGAILLGPGITRQIGLERESTISPDIAWEDYFSANAFLRSMPQRPGVIGASEHGILPVASEVATALAPKLATLAHQKMTPELLAFLKPELNKGAVTSAELSSDWLARARAMGFDTVVWGPVEERQWGAHGRSVLLSEAAPLWISGSVIVFSLAPQADLAPVNAPSPAEVAAFLADLECEAAASIALRRAGYSPMRRNGQFVATPGYGNPETGHSLQSIAHRLDGFDCARDKHRRSP